MIKLILLITVAIILIPMYLYTGKEAIDFIIGTAEKVFPSYDFKKRFWRITRGILIFTWLPVLYVFAHIALVSYIIWRGYTFLKDIRFQALNAWEDIKYQLITKKNG